MSELTIERLKAVVTLVVTCAVNVANVYGYTVDTEQWVNVALSLLSAICILWTWWKNQNVTLPAVQAQAVLDHLKAERKAVHARED